MFAVFTRNERWPHRAQRAWRPRRQVAVRTALPLVGLCHRDNYPRTPSASGSFVPAKKASLM